LQELDLRVEGIESINNTSTFKTQFISWISDVSNDIENIFTKKITTEKICIRDIKGETCLDRSDIDRILGSNNSSISVIQSANNSISGSNQDSSIDTSINQVVNPQDSQSTDEPAQAL
jgi:hypothetical protein